MNTCGLISFAKAWPHCQLEFHFGVRGQSHREPNLGSKGGGIKRLSRCHKKKKKNTPASSVCWSTMAQRHTPHFTWFLKDTLPQGITVNITVKIWLWVTNSQNLSPIQKKERKKENDVLPPRLKCYVLRVSFVTHYKMSHEMKLW